VNHNDEVQTLAKYYVVKANVCVSNGVKLMLTTLFPD